MPGLIQFWGDAVGRRRAASGVSRYGVARASISSGAGGIDEPANIGLQPTAAGEIMSRRG